MKLIRIGTLSFGQGNPEAFSMEEAISYAQQKSLSIQQADLDLNLLRLKQVPQIEIVLKI